MITLTRRTDLKSVRPLPPVLSNKLERGGEWNALVLLLSHSCRLRDRSVSVFKHDSRLLPEMGLRYTPLPGLGFVVVTFSRYLPPGDTGYARLSRYFHLLPSAECHKRAQGTVVLIPALEVHLERPPPLISKRFEVRR